MRVLKGVLKDSEKYYLDIKGKIQRRLSALPKGSVKKRVISKHRYYYFQQRRKDKVVHKYLGKNKPVKLLEQIKERNQLKKELKKVNEALKILTRAKGRS